MIESTIGTAAAAVVGLTSLVNGVRYGFIDDAALGGLLLVVAYGITKVGPLL